MTCRESFEKLDSWLVELDTYATHQNIVKMLVGNKVDKHEQRQVTKQEGINYARRHQMLFVEASARTSENVTGCFEELVAKVGIEFIQSCRVEYGGCRELNEQKCVAKLPVRPSICQEGAEYFHSNLMGT